MPELPWVIFAAARRSQRPQGGDQKETLPCPRCRKAHRRRSPTGAAFRPELVAVGFLHSKA